MTADQQIVMVITAYSVDETAPLFELRGMLWDLAAELDQAAMFECVHGHRPAYPLTGDLDADAGRLTYHIAPVPDQDPDAPAPEMAWYMDKRTEWQPVRFCPTEKIKP